MITWSTDEPKWSATLDWPFGAGVDAATIAVFLAALNCAVAALSGAEHEADLYADAGG